ncbi:MAG: DALR domain-containing protein, partial [Burkholderiaceae bacterium]
QVRPEPVTLDWQANAHAQAFARAMNDDFGTPAAVAVLFDMATEVNRTGSAQAAGWLRALGGVLGLLQDDPQAYLQRGAGAQAPNTTDIEEQIAQRAAAKQAKDYARADAIRQALLEQGITLKDSPSGTTWERT